MNRNQRMAAAGVAIMSWAGLSGLAPVGALIVGFVGALAWDVFLGDL